MFMLLFYDHWHMGALHSPTDWCWLLLRLWAQTALSFPHSVSGESAQSFKVYLTLLSWSMASHL